MKGPVCTDTGARTPISVSRNLSTFLMKYFIVKYLVEQWLRILKYWLSEDEILQDEWNLLWDK